jgi:beta-glucanase (GH16 family)
MPQRDLTLNGRGRQKEPTPPANPFGSNETSSFEGSSTPYSSDDLNNSNTIHSNPMYSPSYYADSDRQSAQHLLAREHPSNVATYNDFHFTSEYNRYPSVEGSRQVSESSLNSHLRDQSDSPAVSKNTPQPPTEKFAEFSPFGGYPASAFPLTIDEKELDDYLHNPDPINDADYDKNRFVYDLKHMDKRSMGGLFGFIGLIIIAGAVFILLPVLTYSEVTVHYKPQAYEILTQYEYPMLSAIRTTLVDPDTPEEAKTMKAKDGSTWVLVFSDEFNAEGRTFYEGDDQFFMAPDLHYAATQDLEWFDPDAVSTSQGTANIRMDAFKNHDLFYRSGMLQSWNKFCFTQGKIEYSARLPNYGDISGLWPGLWTMGNLGRPGYLSTTDGVWPYSYSSCDAGITANQSSPDGISYLPGQRLNSCTCKGEDHPNRGIGRGAPEIDAIEAEVGEYTAGKSCGIASQSLQLAPFDIWYIPDYDWVEIHNSSVTTMNTYAGGPFQQAFSAITLLNTSWYEYGDGEHNFQRYGFEYLNSVDDGYIRWFVGEDPTFTVYSTSLHPNGNIDWRYISKEPMSIIMNLGLSNSWAYINWPSIMFPVTFRIDYVRVYQPKDQINVGCDPPDYPTYDYIQNHLNLYYNNNLTRYTDGGYTEPKNSLLHQC